MLIALLILAGLDTILLLALLLLVRREEEGTPEIEAIGFRFTPQEDPEDEDGC